MENIKALQERLNAAYQYFNYAEEPKHIDASIRLISKYEEELSLLRKKEGVKNGIKNNWFTNI